MIEIFLLWSYDDGPILASNHKDRLINMARDIADTSGLNPDDWENYFQIDEVTFDND